ncbi:hypothetical protein ID853_16705 [Xenorhabdus sp. Vera]|uniref:hypothetical protein n=1 Tax=Xenorhabdus koppenhoeferi TaxID=351659 RepID=UPI00199E117C|nr:hypothetical protein [Xenorhabdus sp. Vera]MBD2812478.1 hypothetical protein [Xenorhabdus sp. Vera]
MHERSDYQVTPPGGKRPEHNQTGFSTDLNPVLLGDSAFTGTFSPLTDLFRLFFTHYLATGRCSKKGDITPRHD